MTAITTTATGMRVRAWFITLTILALLAFGLVLASQQESYSINTSQPASSAPACHSYMVGEPC